MSSRTQATAQQRREERRQAREKLVELRRLLRDARARRKQALLEAKERCRTDRLAARERARALRLRVLEELRGAMHSERAAARETCKVRLREARAIKDDVARSRIAVAAERQLQRDLRAAANADHERRKHAPPCVTCRAESDDEVFANLPSDLATLYDRVKRHIKPQAGSSRTEAFLHWAEKHPHDVLEATREPSHVAVRELETETANVQRRLNPYEAKKAARIERMKARAERLASSAVDARASAQAIASQIPMGQPILVGHHSERRHRRDIERIDRGYKKSVELQRESEALAHRAAFAESNRAISSDDPDAIAKLHAKLADVEEERSRMVLANKLIRGSSNPRAELMEEGFSEPFIDDALTPDIRGRVVGYPGFALRNLASEATRLRKRIEGLIAKASAPAKAPLVGDAVRIEEAQNRVRVFFDAKPEEAIRTKLKRAGFRWSPSVGAWQRHASPMAWDEAKRALSSFAMSPLLATSSPANETAISVAQSNPAESERLRSLAEKHASQPRPKAPELRDTAQIAARIRADIKAEVSAGELPRAKYSVTTDKYSMGSSITVVASALPFPVLNPDAFVVEHGANYMTQDRANFGSRFTARASDVERRLILIVDAYHWNRSDPMSDVYNERFARDVRIEEAPGEWSRIEAAKVAATRTSEERV